MSDTAQTTVTPYDLNSPAFVANPYPVYDHLRRQAPIYWSETRQSWILTRYADIVTLLHDPRLSSDRFATIASRLLSETQAQFRPFITAVSAWMLMRDPPDHTRLRSLVTQAFTPRIVAHMRERIQALVDDLLDAVQDQGHMDVIADLAVPLPGTVIAEMLGVPRTDQPQFKQWSDEITVGLGGADTIGPRTERYRIAQESFLALSAYFQDKVAALRRAPQDHLLSALVQAEAAGDRLTDIELFANCVLLIFAGHETTTNLIGNGLLALLQHPDQLERLRHTPDLMPSAIEEFLRYDSPVQMMSRLATVDVPIAGTQIKHGQRVCLYYAAGNRDPAQFDAPHQLDITRRDNRHLAFGQGVHYCLGAALARLEGQIAINTVLRRLPNLRLATAALEWNPNVILRGLKSLLVTFEPGMAPKV
jgi:hypothetical protein